MSDENNTTGGNAAGVAASVPAELTFGEKAVGLTFNPSGDSAVVNTKKYFAQIIDDMNGLRSDPAASAESKRLYSIAITEAQSAQMWAVKAITWKD